VSGCWIYPRRESNCWQDAPSGLTSSSDPLFFAALPAFYYKFPEKGHKEADTGTECGEANGLNNIIVEYIEQDDQQDAADGTGAGR